MKLTRHIFPGLLGALLIGAAARAEDAADSPYGAIVTRNVFGLVPIPTNPPVDPTPADPPPKITPNGIMDIFGKLQALFKVALPAKAGQPAHDETYVLSVGEQQDEIEVTKIDQKAGMITFNNHGTVQELPLVVGVASGGAAPAGGAPGNSAVPPPAGMPGNNFGNRFGRNPNLARSNPNANPNSAGAPNAGGMPGFGANGAGANNSPQAEENLSPEAQVLLIEKNRLDTQEQVTRGILPPLPPTAITPPDATAADGSPLIATPGEPAAPK